MMLAECLKSRYLTYHAFRDAGIDPSRAATITDIIHGHEPTHDEPDDMIGDAIEWQPAPDDHFEPSEADWKDYCLNPDRLDTLQAIHDSEEKASARAVGQ